MSLHCWKLSKLMGGQGRGCICLYEFTMKIRVPVVAIRNSPKKG